MGRDSRKRQQAAVKKKARREKRKAARLHGPATDWRWGVSRTAVRHAPIHACLMTANLFKIGIGHVVIARRLPAGEIVAGHFMVDAQCLGVKGQLRLPCQRGRKPAAGLLRMRPMAGCTGRGDFTDPCPCGSGKKYKKCCGKVDGPT